MARSKNTTQIDLSERVNLTAGAIERLACPPGKAQAFMRDSEVPALRVRVTKAGAKAFVFETKLDRQTIRRTIGDVRTWTIEQARAEARRLAVLVDSGTDPRELARQQQAEREAASAQAAAEALTVGEAWGRYVTERRPHWGEAHRRDHEKMVRAGGEPARRGTRGKGTTAAGPLHSLLALRLTDLDTPTIERWAAVEGQARPTQARLALRLLRAFINWCSEHPDYKTVIAGNPTMSRRAREALGKPQAKADALLREQLPGWFAAVVAIGNPVISAYLQALLLTGARPGEVRALRWDDVNTKWRGLTIRDKVEGERLIPLCPYVHHLLAGLPRRGPFVFAGLESTQPMSWPHHQHAKACAVAGVPGLTLHGLRRSFKSLSEWLELPAGVVAQIMGHKPSATAEKHYTVRPLDLLRVHHERLERWILEQAGVQFDAQAEPGKLRAVG